MSDKLKAVVAALAPEGEGWWKSDTDAVLQAAAAKMEAAGMSEPAIIDVLESVIGAMQEEYGE